MPNPDSFHDVIQIAGIIDELEAGLILDCGVRYLGFPLRLPVNAEDLPEKQAADIIRSIRPPGYGVAITYQYDADDIIEFMDFLGAPIVQLHGDIELSELERVRQLRPALRVIKSLVVGCRGDDELVRTAQRMAPLVDAFITDTFDPTTGASGATGKTHDWHISRRLVDISPKPVILAGGLTPDNVRDAILTVAPAGVDVHTGVEAPSGRKDRAKVVRFVAEARAGFHLVRSASDRASSRHAAENSI